MPDTPRSIIPPVLALVAALLFVEWDPPRLPTYIRCDPPLTDALDGSFNGGVLTVGCSDGRQEWDPDASCNLSGSRAALDELHKRVEDDRYTVLGAGIIAGCVLGWGLARGGQRSAREGGWTVMPFDPHRVVDHRHASIARRLKDTFLAGRGQFEVGVVADVMG
jgi:hypothetical protein